MWWTAVSFFKVEWGAYGLHCEQMLILTICYTKRKVISYINYTQISSWAVVCSYIYCLLLVKFIVMYLADFLLCLCHYESNWQPTWYHNGGGSYWLSISDHYLAFYLNQNHFEIKPTQVYIKLKLQTTLILSCYSISKYCIQHWSSKAEHKSGFETIPYLNFMVSYRVSFRNHFMNAPSQWEMALLCNVIFHWLGTYIKLSLLLLFLRKLTMS